MEEKRVSSRKTRVGLVVSDKMDKTVVVAIADRVAHPLYKKIVKSTYKLKAHDEKNECGVGDRVRMNALDGADDHSADNLALLHGTTGLSLADRGDDHVAEDPVSGSRSAVRGRRRHE